MTRKVLANRVSLRDVADVAGVSHPTVSRALTGDQGVSEKTRERIKKIAKELGYRRDPALSALASYRTAKQRPIHHGKLAYLHPWGGEFANRDCYTIKVFLPLVKERAEEVGYSIDVFTFFPSPKEQRRISNILYSQGIVGVFVGEMPPGHSTLDFIAWNRFSALALDSSLKSPRLPYISDATPKRMDVTYHKLRSAGYKRIGYLTRRTIEENVDNLFLSAYLKCLYHDGLSASDLPPYFYHNWQDLNPVPWLKKHKFDAVITTLSQELLMSLEKTHYRVPQDLGMSTLYLRPDDPPQVAGCSVDWSLWGTIAVDLLNNRIHHGDRGTNTVQTGMFLDTIWHAAFTRDGATLPKVETA